MKIVIAALAAAGLLFGSFLVYQSSSLQGEIQQLERRLANISRLLEAPPANNDTDDDQRLTDLETRLATAEDSARTTRDDSTSVDVAGSLSKVLDQVTANAKAIDEVRDLVAGAGRTSNALDETAERFLSAVGGDRESGENGERGGGLSRLIEAGSLFSKRSEDLTEEEKAQRDAFSAEMRDRQVDWAVRGFDRALSESTKLSDDQKQSIGALLAEENTALSGLRDQELSDEQQSESRKNIRADTDGKVSRLLDAEQQEAWTKRRSRRQRSFPSFRR